LYDIVVVGDEPHLAYNRVGLTSYFKHRAIEQLYMQPKEWVRYDTNVVGIILTITQYESQAIGSLTCHLSTLVKKIDSANKVVLTNNGDQYHYDLLVLATGSTAILPRMPGYDAKGVFVYRTIDDLTGLISFSAAKKGKGEKGVVIGGGLLGLEAAKAMLDLGVYEKITVLEAMPYVLARQLDQDAGMMVVEQVKALGVDVVLGKMVAKLTTDENGNVSGVEFKDGEIVEGSCVCFAVSPIIPANAHLY
jgi:nitrite reductase (NAD(P)H)